MDRHRRGGLGHERGRPVRQPAGHRRPGAGLDPKILLAANTIGGGLGKIVSPQNLAIASTAVDAPGTDAEILKKAAPYSIGLLLVLGTLVFLASQVGLGV